MVVPEMAQNHRVNLQEKVAALTRTPPRKVVRRTAEAQKAPPAPAMPVGLRVARKVQQILRLNQQRLAAVQVLPMPH